jgi:DNA-binding protein Fis
MKLKSLKGYIVEEKNTHMEHLEDLIFNEGSAGTKKAINFLKDLRDMLAGHSTSKITATVKWDGAPAIFAGIDPRDGKFFIAKKGMFNKEPKIYKTNAEIDADTTGDLAAKFKVALTELKKLGIKSGVYQGDLMFTKSDLKKETIDGQKYITFHPNTIVYAVPENSDLANTIKQAKIGVVWHTTYTGDSFETMKASFGKSIVQHLKPIPSVWMDDANYKDYSGTATFTAAETTILNGLINKAQTKFNGIKLEALDAISQNEELLLQIKTYNNTKIRSGEGFSDTKAHVKGLFDYIHAKLEPKQKTEKGKAAGEEKRKAVLKYFSDHNPQDIQDIFDLANAMTEAKDMIVAKMNQAGHISTFLKTTNGFKTTGVEGFVAIDHLKGGAVKVINRMEFSRSNFSADIIKGWQR